MLQITPEPIEFPDHERIARQEGLEAGTQTWTVLLATRGEVFVEALGRDAGSQQGIMLEVHGLGAVTLRDPHVPDQHRRLLHPPEKLGTRLQPGIDFCNGFSDGFSPRNTEVRGCQNNARLVVFQKWRWTEIDVTLGLVFVASLRKEWPMTFIRRG